MAVANEIISASSYTGSKELGGYVASAIDIDTKPLQSLAAFTVMQNRAFYDQRVKDADQKVAELASLTQYNLAAARGKDKEDQIKDQADLTQYMKEYAQRGVPKNPQEKIQQEVDLQEKITSNISRIKARNGRMIAYNARLNAINQENTTASIKAEKKKQLDEEFDSTNWDTPISAEEKYTATFPVIADPVYTKNTTSVKVGNQIVQQTVSFFSPATNMNNATAEELGLANQTTLPANASPEQQREFRLRQATGGQTKILNDAATFLNEALSNPKYKKEDGTIDEEAVAADNSIAYSILKGIDRYNKYALDLKEDATKGYYTTKLGRQVDLLNIVNPSDIFTIDKNKPLSPAQLIFIEKFLKASPDTKEEKIVVTGEDNTRLNILLDAENQRKNREEQARQFDLTRKDKNAPVLGGDGNTQTTGNAFDEIGGTQEVVLAGGKKISNGIVVDSKNNVVTGKLWMSVTDLPANMIAALTSAKIEVATDGVIPVTVKDGVITSIIDATNKPISRQGMENAQKKFDTEQKGQIRTQWGRLLEQNVLPATNKPAQSGGMTPQQYAEFIRKASGK